MKRKFLEDMGLTKEQVDSIMTENGNDIEAAKGDLEQVKTELEQTKTQLQAELAHRALRATLTEQQGRILLIRIELRRIDNPR